jgi:hypothetical protein
MTKLKKVRNPKPRINEQNRGFDVGGVTVRKSGMKVFMAADMRMFSEKLGRQIVRDIRLFAPRGETGRTAATLAASAIKIRGYTIHFTVGSHSGHSLYPDQGTGIYAGRGYIRPKRARALVFRPKGSAAFVFAQRVKGQPPQHFMQKGLTVALARL